MTGRRQVCLYITVHYYPAAISALVKSYIAAGPVLLPICNNIRPSAKSLDIAVLLLGFINIFVVMAELLGPLVTTALPSPLHKTGQ
jgi:hypothetical protein